MRRSVLFVFFMLALAILSAEEVPIRQAFDIGWEGFHLRTVDNCEIVFWTDTPVDSRDIFAQKIGPNGQALWPEPIPLANQAGDQRLLAVAASSDNNFILLWEEYEIETTLELRMQKVTSNGQRLWGENGVQVSSGNQDVFDIQLVPNAVGGAYVVWHNFIAFNTIAGQNVDGFGNQLWPAGGITLATHSSNIGLDSAVSDGEGGLIIDVTKSDITELTRFSPQGTVVGNNPLIAPGSMPNFSTYSILQGVPGEYILYRFGYSPNAGLWQRKINNQGIPLAPYTVVASLPIHENYDLPPKIAATADGGTVVCYEAFPTSGSMLLAQRFNADFDLMWDYPGVQIATSTDSAWYKLDLAVTGQGAVWLSWSQFDAAQDSYLIRAQYVEPVGSLPWGSTGQVVSGLESSSYLSVPMAYPDRGMFAWLGQTDQDKSVRRQVVSTGGALFLGAGGEPVVQRPAGQAYIRECLALNDKFLSVWTDTRQGQNIHYQLSDLDLDPLLDGNGQALNAWDGAIEEIISAQRTPWNTVAILYQRWLDSNYLHYLQQVDSNGVKLYPGLGVQITGNIQASQFQMGFSGGDVYLGYRFADQTNYTHQIKGQRISNGQKMWGEEGITLRDYPEQSSWPVFRNVAGRYFVWNEFNNNPDSSICKALLLDANGAPAAGWSSDGLDILDTGAAGESWDLLHSGLAGDDLVAFARRISPGAYVSRAQRINSSGQRLWPEAGVDLGQSEYIWVESAVYGTETAILYNLGSSQSNQLRFQKLSAAGELLLAPGGTVVAADLHNCYDPKLVRFADGSYLCAWSDNDSAWIQNRDLFIRPLDPQGNPLEAGPTVFCAARYEQDNVRVAVIGNRAMLAWTDDRAGILNSEEAIWGVWANAYASTWVGADDPNLAPPLQPIIHANYPNPFNPSTTISFSLPDRGEAELAVYNLKGQLVTTLQPASMLSAGRHEVVWGGRDNAGKPVSSGIYFCRLSCAGQTATRKLVLSK